MAKISLSFDNGPDPDVTPQVLDVLAGEGIRASFFVLGQKIADPSCRSLTERAAAEGHWIGNHTYTHSVPLGEVTEPGRAGAEIRDTQALISDLAHPDALFRPFGGGGVLGKHLLNAEARAVLEDDAMTCVLWNSIPEDWKDPEGWLDRALAQIGELDHALVVLHDLPTGAMNQLPTFIDRTRSAGHAFVQGFPADCVPLRNGVAGSALDEYITQ
ncbi:MAG: polysaccharide deacetylase family protein [Paracoccaceae bacterium]